MQSFLQFNTDTRNITFQFFMPKCLYNYTAHNQRRQSNNNMKLAIGQGQGPIPLGDEISALLKYSRELV